MTRQGDRAVAVALDRGKVLVMRRFKRDDDDVSHEYCVLPGGGVEPGE